MSSMAPLYLLDHDDLNEIQNDIFGQVISLVPGSALCDANDTIVFGHDNLVLVLVLFVENFIKVAIDGTISTL